jgi:hypothetical protein
MCGEALKSGASHCQFCGERVVLKANSPSRIARIRKFEPLPELCALCGERAALKREMTFLGTIGELRLFSIEKNAGTTVMLPLCHRHRFFRLGWPNTVGFLLSLPILLIFIAGYLHQSGVAIPLLVFGILIVLDLVLIAWVIIRALRIRTGSSHESHVVLIGVAPQFAEACEAIEQKEFDRVEQSLADFLGGSSVDSSEN